EAHKFRRLSPAGPRVESGTAVAISHDAVGGQREAGKAVIIRRVVNISDQVHRRQAQANGNLVGGGIAAGVHHAVDADLGTGRDRSRDSQDHAEAVVAEGSAGEGYAWRVD